jgi:hypothetical protein
MTCKPLLLTEQLLSLDDTEIDIKTLSDLSKSLVEREDTIRKKRQALNTILYRILMTKNAKEKRNSKTSP